MRHIRPWLFVALVFLGNAVFIAALNLWARDLAEWMVRHGLILSGAWGQAVLLEMFAVAFTLIIGVSSWLASLGAPLPRRPGATKTVLFIHGLLILLLAWTVAASSLDRLLAPHLPSGLALCLAPLVLLLGVLAIAFAGERVATRLGITLGTRKPS